MTEDSDESRTQMSHKRTELAYERTVLAYFRTGASLILFSFAFLGFSEGRPLFLYGGYTALIAGVLFLGIGVIQGRKHLNEMKAFAGHEARRVKKVAEKVLDDDE